MFGVTASVNSLSVGLIGLAYISFTATTMAGKVMDVGGVCHRRNVVDQAKIPLIGKLFFIIWR